MYWGLVHEEWNIATKEFASENNRWILYEWEQIGIIAAKV